MVVLMLTATEAMDAAEKLVDDYCVQPPAEIRIAAIAKLAEHLRSYPSDGLTNTQFGDQGASWKPSSRALLDSGASALLASWRRPRARLIEATE